MVDQPKVLVIDDEDAARYGIVRALSSEGYQIEEAADGKNALARVQDASNPLSKELLSVPQLSVYYLGLNVSLPPFDDPKVRQAFALLIDRARVAEVTLDGSAVGARGILPPGIPGYNPQLPAPEHDIERARALIAESRYGGPEGLPPILATFHPSYLLRLKGRPGGEEAERLFVADLRKAASAA